MKQDDLFCADLPSKPLPEIGKVLVTGASGYIGGRLVPELLARGYKVRAMVRADSSEYAARWPEAEIAIADALESERLKSALEGIGTAYYLLHSLNLGPKEFEAVDLKAAVNFRKAAEEKRIKRIIYLGGLGDIRSPLSSHLRTRIEIAEQLKMGKTPVTILRAAVIIGSGSASYEIIYNLVKKSPVILVPHWAKNKCEPIAIRDVIKYLVGVLEIPQTTGKSFDIGGRAPLTYERMMKVVAIVLNRRIFFIPFFLSNIRFYSYFTSLLTPVPAPITQCLMEGLRNEVICQEHEIRTFLPFKPMPYKEAVVRAMSREEQDGVHTRWSDAYPPAHELAIKLHELKRNANHIAHYSLVSEKSALALFSCLCKIGGKEGWFHGNWIWRLRGMLDRILLGVGTLRGRKKDSNLKINDVIDFWRVEDLKRNQRLLLRAEMKLPGRAWLEFLVGEVRAKRRLSVIAYFDTHSLLGEMYWYACMPFHYFVFRKLIEDIEERS